VDALQYPTYGSFASDVRLTFRNALQFNVQGDEVYNAAIEVIPLSWIKITYVLYTHRFSVSAHVQHVLRCLATVLMYTASSSMLFFK
jgi:hypothetical protein